MNIVGYHGCKLQFARALESDTTPIADWRPSDNVYDWLGKGVYFWEGSKRRAIEWAKEHLADSPAVIEAEIDLGHCFDLTDTDYLDLIRDVYDSLVELFREENWVLPRNRSVTPKDTWRRKLCELLDHANAFIYSRFVGISFQRLEKVELRKLDRLVIDQFMDLMENGAGNQVIQFDTIRCPFEEGEPLFPGSMIRNQTHIQIAVRNIKAIKSVRIVSIS